MTLDYSHWHASRLLIAPAKSPNNSQSPTLLQPFSFHAFAIHHVFQRRIMGGDNKDIVVATNCLEVFVAVSRWKSFSSWKGSVDQCFGCNAVSMSAPGQNVPRWNGGLE